MSCGEDGKVCQFDLRASDSPVATIPIQDISASRPYDPISVYSVSIHPLEEHLFLAGGTSPRAFLYDLRMTPGSSGFPSMGYYRPTHLHDSSEHITSLKYNSTGTEIIASYNDESIYSFDSKKISIRRLSDEGESGFKTCFEGHRNRQTIKQVNYMGPRDEFVISGSDCGHVFIWNASGKVIHVTKGDNVGAVNCLTPHPFLPFLVTSGLEHTGKLWGLGRHPPLKEEEQEEEGEEDGGRVAYIERVIERNKAQRRRPRGERGMRRTRLSTRLLARLLQIYPDLLLNASNIQFVDEDGEEEEEAGDGIDEEDENGAEDGHDEEYDMDDDVDSNDDDDDYDDDDDDDNGDDGDMH